MSISCFRERTKLMILEMFVQDPSLKKKAIYLNIYFFKAIYFCIPRNTKTQFQGPTEIKMGHNCLKLVNSNNIYPE